MIGGRDGTPNVNVFEVFLIALSYWVGGKTRDFWSEHLWDEVCYDVAIEGVDFEFVLKSIEDLDFVVWSGNVLEFSDLLDEVDFLLSEFLSVDRVVDLGEVLVVVYVDSVGLAVGRGGVYLEVVLD